MKINFQLPLELESNVCGSLGNGFNLFFHLPNELMTLQKHKPNLIEYNQDRLVSISAKTFTAKVEVKKYPPFTRNCYFEGERSLKFFKQYTEPMCRLVLNYLM